LQLPLQPLRLYAYDAALACDAWFEWVPSGANIADLPSRHAATWSAESAELIADYRAQGCVERALEYPSVAELQSASAAVGRGVALAALARQRRAACV
jgi:hypothetical protein